MFTLSSEIKLYLFWIPPLSIWLEQTLNWKQQVQNSSQNEHNKKVSSPLENSLSFLYRKFWNKFI